MSFFQFIDTVEVVCLGWDLCILLNMNIKVVKVYVSINMMSFVLGIHVRWLCVLYTLVGCRILIEDFRWKLNVLKHWQLIFQHLGLSRCLFISHLFVNSRNFKLAVRFKLIQFEYNRVDFNRYKQKLRGRNHQNSWDLFRF